MAGWEVPLGIVLTALGGIALALQAGINSSLGQHVTKPLAAVISFGIGLAGCCLYLLVDATAVSKQLPTKAGVAGAPWWTWIGGALGAYYVCVNVIFAQKLGAGTSVAVFVCSQLACSIVLDLAGLVGFQKRAFAWQRILGFALMVVGVILVTKFPGAPIHSAQPAQPQRATELQQKQPQQQQQQHPLPTEKQKQEAPLPSHLMDTVSGGSLLPTALYPNPSTTSTSSSISSSGSSTTEFAPGGSSISGVSSSRGLRGLLSWRQRWHALHGTAEQQ